MKRFVAALAALLLVSCSTDDKPSNLPPKPVNGDQFVLPNMTIEPGSDQLLCWYTTLDSDVDVWVNQFEVFQGDGGHHLIAFTSDEDIEDGTVTDCSSPLSMALLRPLLTATDLTGFDLPDGYAVRVPANTKLVFQTHYVNASDLPVKVRDVVNLHYVDGTGITPVGSFANTTVSFSIPPNAQQFNVTYECAIPQDMNVFMLLAHMHETGVRYDVSVGQPGNLQSVLSVDPWMPEYRDAPPKRVWTMDAPLVLSTTDVIRVSCTWTNPTASALGFPNEMCASLVWLYPSTEPLVCTEDPL